MKKVFELLGVVPNEMFGIVESGKIGEVNIYPVCKDCTAGPVEGYIDENGGLYWRSIGGYGATHGSTELLSGLINGDLKVVKHGKAVDWFGNEIPA